MKTIITCAITGAGTTKEQTPYLPITPQEIAQSALEAADAGAAVVHIHVRDPQTGRPSMNLAHYQEVWDTIKAKNTNVLINLTTGPGSTGPADVIYGNQSHNFQPAEARTKHVVALKPDICSLDLNTMNRGPKQITVNPIDTCRKMIQIVQAAGVKPELEIFDSGDMAIAKMLIEEGTLSGTPLWQIAAGVKWGWTATPGTLEYAKSLLPPGSTWYAFGTGAGQMPFVALSTISGGHARVGLEDNIYLERGVLAKTNAELVEKAVRIIRELGNEPATPAEAREILSLGK
jgi:uncharacterized protein (DUF849 family)